MCWLNVVLHKEQRIEGSYVNKKKRMRDTDTYHWRIKQSTLFEPVLQTWNHRNSARTAQR